MRRFLALGLLLTLSGCGTFEQWFASTFLKKTAATDIEQSDRHLAFTVPATVELSVFSSSLAHYATACWIMDDPSYSLQPPAVREKGGMQMSLISKEDGTNTEALRLVIAEPKTGEAYNIMAYGPLAHPQYEDPLLRGLHRAAVGKSECE